MKIKYKGKYWCLCKNNFHPHYGIKKPERHGKGNFFQYVLAENTNAINYCCEEMKQAFNAFVLLGDKCEGNLVIRDGDGVTDDCSCDEMEISFCPFCGSKIEMMEVE